MSSEYIDARNQEIMEIDKNLEIFHFLQGLNNKRSCQNMPQLMGFMGLFKLIVKAVLCFALVLLVPTMIILPISIALGDGYETEGVLLFNLNIVGLVATYFVYKKLFSARITSLFDRMELAITYRQYRVHLRKPLLSFIMDHMIYETEINESLSLYYNTNVQCSYMQAGMNEDYAPSLCSIAAQHKG
jgi:hypothetical protein